MQIGDVIMDKHREAHGCYHAHHVHVRQVRQDRQDMEFLLINATYMQLGKQQDESAVVPYAELQPTQ